MEKKSGSLPRRWGTAFFGFYVADFLTELKFGSYLAIFSV